MNRLKRAWTATPNWILIVMGIAIACGGTVITAPVVIPNNAVTDAKLRDSVGLSVIGRSANTTGDPGNIVAGVDGDVLRLSGTTLGFGSIPEGSVTGVITDVTAGAGLTGGASSGTATVDITASSDFSVGADLLDLSTTITAPGTLDTVGDFSVATNKFNVTASSGNTTVAGTLGVTGAITEGSSPVLSGTIASNTIPKGSSGNLANSSVTDDGTTFKINTNKFTVTEASGNTVAAGTFNSQGAGDFDTTLNVDGIATAQVGVVLNNTSGDTDVRGQLYVRGGNTNAPASILAAQEWTVGRNGSGTAQSTDASDIAFQFGGSGGGFRHWITTWHNSAADTGNRISFYLNTGATAAASSAPGTGNTRVLDLNGDTSARFYGAETVDGNSFVRGSLFLVGAGSALSKTGLTGPVEITKDAASQIAVSAYGTGTAPEFMALRGRGTGASTTAVQNGDVLGALAFAGAEDATTIFSGVFFRATATENWTTGTQGAKLELSTTAPSGGARAVRMTIADSGAATFAQTLSSTGDFAVNTNKFTVTASSGNTVVAGTFAVTGNFAVNTNKFTVTASNGNTLVAGTLTSVGDASIGDGDANGTYAITTSGANVEFTGVSSHKGHTRVTGTALGNGDLSTCGGGTPTASGTDVAGRITEGTTATACTLTFKATWTSAPYCVCSAETAGVAVTCVATATTLIFSNLSASGDVFTFVCMGQSNAT